MSGVRVYTPDREQILAIKQQQGCDVEMAKRLARLENIEAAVHQSEDIEDLKVCMIALIGHVRLRP